jgi:hypothetical protein
MSFVLKKFYHFLHPPKMSHLAQGLLTFGHPMMISIFRRYFLSAVFVLTSTVLFAAPGPDAKVKANMHKTLEGIQQALMDLQAGLRDMEENGRCTSCESSIAQFERQVANAAWFMLAVKPDFYHGKILPGLRALTAWENNPDAVPNVHQVVGDLMTQCAYVFLLFEDVKWDAAFWDRAALTWQAQKDQLGLPEADVRRAHKAFDKALKSRP